MCFFHVLHNARNTGFSRGRTYGKIDKWKNLSII